MQKLQKVKNISKLVFKIKSFDESCNLTSFLAKVTTTFQFYVFIDI